MPFYVLEGDIAEAVDLVPATYRAHVKSSHESAATRGLCIRPPDRLAVGDPDAPLVEVGDSPAAVVHAFDELLDPVGTGPRLEQ